LDAAVRTTVAVYSFDAAKLVAEGDQIRLVTVYWAGSFDARAERETGVAPATGASNPITPADVIAVVAGTTAGGKLTANVNVLPGPFPDTMPVPTVPVSTIGVMDEDEGNV